MRRFRLWLACKLVGRESFIVNTTFTAPVTLAISPDKETTVLNCTFTNGANLSAQPVNTSSRVAPNWSTTESTSTIWYGPGTYSAKEDEMGKKKKRSKAAGKAAAKNKQEQKSKARGGKGAR